VFFYFWAIGYIAKEKGYKRLYWWIAAVFFPGLTLIVVLFAHHKDGNPIS
jgi:hypothetical protein